MSNELERCMFWCTGWWLMWRSAKDIKASQKAYLKWYDACHRFTATKERQ